MNEAEYQELLETSWRRGLSPAEEARLHAWLAERPELRASWEVESGLNHFLDQLPDAPVASNFTALVLQEARRESARPVARSFLSDLWQRLFLRPATGVAWVALMVGLGWLAVQQAQTNSRRGLADGIATLIKTDALSDPAMLQDFDAIRRLPQAEDEELFAVLSK